MKIQELSNLSGVPVETIRFYRNEGYLHPKKQANGYYDYTRQDFVNLLYVRKLRSFSLSNKEIQSSYFSNETKQQIDSLDAETEMLKNQILDYQEQLQYIAFEKQHILESQTTHVHPVLKAQSIDEKVDFYQWSQYSQDPFAHSFSRIYRMTTPTICIQKDILNGLCTDKEIPIQIGIGTYRHILNQLQVKPPKEVVIVPNGIYLAQTLELDSLDHINLLQLKPMMDQAKKEKTPFVSDTTGYLLRVLRKKNSFTYAFRIRACILPNEIKNY